MNCPSAITVCAVCSPQRLRYTSTIERIEPAAITSEVIKGDATISRAETKKKINPNQRDAKTPLTTDALTPFITSEVIAASPIRWMVGVPQILRRTHLRKQLCLSIQFNRSNRPMESWTAFAFHPIPTGALARCGLKPINKIRSSAATNACFLWRWSLYLQLFLG